MKTSYNYFLLYIYTIEVMYFLIFIGLLFIVLKYIKIPDDIFNSFNSIMTSLRNDVNFSICKHLLGFTVPNHFIEFFHMDEPGYTMRANWPSGTSLA